MEKEIKVDIKKLEKRIQCDIDYSNYVERYGYFKGSFDDFLDLEEVPYRAKIHVSKLLLNLGQLTAWGGFSVLILSFLCLK